MSGGIYGWLGLVVVGIVLAVVAAVVPMGPTPTRLVNAAGIICIVVGLLLLVLSLVGVLA